MESQGSSPLPHLYCHSPLKNYLGEQQIQPFLLFPYFSIIRVTTLIALRQRKNWEFASRFKLQSEHLYVEKEVHYIAVLDGIILTFS